MVTILSRSRWTSTSARGSAINWSRVRGIVCHYPATGRSVGVLSEAQEAARLRGWRSYHVNSLGWKDIGYSYGIGQSGRIYSLRGDRVGGHTFGHNSTTLGVLFIVGDNEPLTAAAKASFRALRATLRKRGASSGVWGHTEMSGNSTRCPGPYIMGSIRNGELTGASGGTTAPKPGTSKPAPDSSRPWRTSPRVNGMSAATVRKIQGEVDVTQDGVYGDQTGRAVRDLQAELDLTADGVWGPATEAEVASIKAIVTENQKRIDRGNAILVENQKRITAIEGKVKAAIDYHVPRVTFRSGLYDEDGNPIEENLAGALRRVNKHTGWNNVKNDRIEGKVEALLQAVDQLSGGEIDVEAIKQAAFDGATHGAAEVEAHEVAELLKLSVREDAGDDPEG